MITRKRITCQLKFLEKMIEKFFFSNFFNKFVTKISCNMRIFYSDGHFIKMNADYISFSLS